MESHSLKIMAHVRCFDEKEKQANIYQPYEKTIFELKQKNGVYITSLKYYLTSLKHLHG